MAIKRIVIEYDEEKDVFNVETGNMNNLALLGLLEHVKMQVACNYYETVWKDAEEDKKDDDESLFQ